MSCPCPSPSPPPLCTTSSSTSTLSGMVRAFFGSETSIGYCNDSPLKRGGVANIIQPLGRPTTGCGDFKNSFTTKIFTGSGEDFVIQDYSCK